MFTVCVLTVSVLYISEQKACHLKLRECVKTCDNDNNQTGKVQSSFFFFSFFFSRMIF